MDRLSLRFLQGHELVGLVRCGRGVIDAVARAASGAAISIMAQYRPAHRAAGFPELLGRVRMRGVQSLRGYAKGRGLVCLIT
jgi:uncharacterized Fe-S radical SAM superfamily protein PflX